MMLDVLTLDIRATDAFSTHMPAISVLNRTSRPDDSL